MSKIVPYDSKYFVNTITFLSFLEPNYPDYVQWANRKLTDTNTVVYLMLDNNEIVGVSVGNSKLNNRFKVSTFYVTPSHQNRGFGSKLLRLMEKAALHENRGTIYMTANSQLRETLGVFLKHKNFLLVNSVKDKYLPGQVEDIYEKTLI